ncbi:YcnI family protein [Breoghania sp.]|uniref:YcnI family copper-binding membrane protein n=1 Tax=Breoghania sp. TaxID=2065378 RepID=UPI002AAB800F|nr:YcnI family protein [Breoghania sp.]
MSKSLTLAGAMLAFAITSASAHVTLEQSEAPVGSTYKATFRLPHGCSGKTTTAVRIQIPEGFVAVKPMPKPGWTLEKTHGKYEKAYDYYHGAKLTEGVKEVSWSGGNLPDDEYDEFVLRGMLTDGLPAGETFYFPVVQECVDGAVTRWIETPAKGEAEPDHPAPGLKLLEKAHSHH